MIKPFTVLDTKPAENGATAVLFTVSKSTVNGPADTDTVSMKTIILVPAGEDIDAYLFKALGEMGWL